MSAVRFAVVALIVACIVHVGAVQALPRVIMGRVLARLAEGRSANQMYHPPRIDEDSRDVVRPSPDLLYSVCLFDLSSGPVRVVAPPSGSYASVSGFGANTDNFFAVNDRDVHPDPVEVVLVEAGRRADAPAGASVVESPSTRGLVLVRRVIESEARFAELGRIRSRERCEPVSSSER